MKLTNILSCSVLLSSLMFLAIINSTIVQADATTDHTDKNQPEIYNDKSKTILIEKLAKFHYFQANFTQTVVDEDDNIVAEASGKLTISKPNLVNWQTLLPDETSIISDGETLWFYDPFISQATAYDLKNSIADTPILLLTSESPELWQSYGVIQQSTDSFIIESLSDNRQIKSLTLHFKGDELAQFSLLDTTGQLSHFRLTEFDQNTKPDVKLFQFTVPEGVTVDDQR